MVIHNNFLKFPLFSFALSGNRVYSAMAERSDRGDRRAFHLFSGVVKRMAIFMAMRKVAGN
jgi:hypothetical protein